MNKTLFAFVCIFLIFTLPIESIADPIRKSGILSTNEVWTGEIEITGDIVIPENITLTIEPGTKISTSHTDDRQSGLFKDKPEITVFGNLNIKGDHDNFVTLGEKKSDNASTLIPIDSSQTIVVSPFQINTEPLREEFRQFRIQYVILWTILSFSVYYAIRKRN